MRNLPNDIEQLCTLQRMQTIHPQIFSVDPMIKQDKDNFYGDMTQIPSDRLNCEEDLLPTAISMFAELLRRNNNYSINRAAKDKINILCKGNALMLASTLKAKNIPARVRVGWAKYHYNTGLCDDQWNTEYYDIEQEKWIMVDSSGIGGNEKGIRLMILDGHKDIEAAWTGLMKNPDENLQKLQHIWNKKEKFKELLGISTWN